MDALVINPGNGSLWLSDIYYITVDGMRYIVGEAWDDDEVGSPYLPADYRGETITMNFPVNCILQTRGGVI